MKTSNALQDAQEMHSRGPSNPLGPPSSSSAPGARLGARAPAPTPDFRRGAAVTWGPAGARPEGAKDLSPGRQPWVKAPTIRVRALKGRRLEKPALSGPNPGDLGPNPGLTPWAQIFTPFQGEPLRGVLAFVAFLLLALAPAAAQDLDPPSIAVLESGQPLTDGSLFARAVAPVIQVVDASTFTVAATLDGQPYVSGTAIHDEGQHELLVTATDAGNQQATLAIGFEIDRISPVFVAIAPATGSVTSAAAVSLAGQLDGPASLKVDGAAVAVNAGGQFVAGPYSLTEGNRDFALVATDAAGNSTARSHRVVRDAVAPALAITSPANLAVVGASPRDIEGTFADAHAVTVTVGGVAATMTGNTWKARVPLAEGGNDLTARAVDAAGNASTATRRVVLDSLPPQISITDPATATVVPGASIVVSGAASDAHLDRVEVGGVAATLTGGGFSATVPLEAGDNLLEAKAFDELGLAATATVTVRRDAAAPSIEIDSPADGSYLAASEVTVSGTLGAGSGLTVTVGGEPATVDGSSFTLAGVALAEGENRLIARVTDGAGNQGTHAILVYRDTVAPQLLSTAPAGGAIGIAGDTNFVVTFSEKVSGAPPAAFKLENAAGTSLAAQGGYSGSSLVVEPNAALPSQAVVRLTIGAGIVDRAGNTLAAPQTFEFTTRDGQAPAMPNLQPAPPAALCAARLELSGTAEPLSSLQVSGGAAAAGTQAGEGGAFTLSVPLVPGQLHQLSLTARDAEGNLSPPRLFALTHDCRPPALLTAELVDGAFEITFDEKLAAASLTAAAVKVFAGEGQIAGTINLTASGEVVIFTPAAALPAGALRLDVATSVRDLAGNPLAFPFSQVFGADEGDSFVAGRVIDAATGRPLAGALVLVIASSGNPAPEPQQTTGDDGRFSIALPAGSHFLLMRRPGYTPAFRYEQALPGLGADLIDPRLTPAAEAEEIGAAGGSFASEGNGPVLAIPANALAATAQVAVTALEEQALPALLPYGWSPRGAVWLDLGGAVLAAPAELSFAVALEDGVTVPVVRLDPVTLQWHVIELAPVVDGRVTALAAGEGAYAAVEGDPAPLAPPTAVAGAVLGSAEAPNGENLISAALAFDPELVLPSQRSEVTATYQVAAPVGSGLPLTLRIREELTLLGGTVRHQPTYESDLILYHDASGTPSSRFGLRPSPLAQQAPIEVGAEEVLLRRYLGATVRGNVLGPAGGVVETPEGDRVELSPGGLAAPTPVVLTRRGEDDLPVELPAGLELAGLLDLDLAGQTLGQPANLSLQLGAPPAAGQGLLFGFESRDGAQYLRPLAQLEATAGGWRTAAIDPQDLAWPGIRHGGLYLFARSEEPLAFVRGKVFGLEGEPLPGAWVSAPQIAWIQVAGEAGSYVLPIELSTAWLEARNLATLDSGVAALAAAPVVDQRVDLELRIFPSGPRIVGVTPADGSVSVTLGIEPTITFTEALDPASLPAGIQLFDGLQPVPASLEVQGALVRLVPDASLRPGRSYELRVSALVRDLEGHRLEAGGSFRFTTIVLPVYDDIDLTKVHLFEPNAQGDARVLGRVGAVPAGALVFVENVSRLIETPAVTAGSDGAFELLVDARLSDVLLLHVVPTGRNETVLELTPFQTADGKGAYVGQGAAAFTTLEGIEVKIAAGTFDRPTLVRLSVVPTTAIKAKRPDDFDLLYAFDLDTGGVMAKKAMQLRIPVAHSGQFPILMGREVNHFGEWYWTFDALLRPEDGMLTTEDDPEELAQAFASPWAPRPVARLAATSGAAMLEIAVGAASLGQPETPRPYLKSEYLPGAANPGRYMLLAAREQMDYLLMPLSFINGLSGFLLNTAMEGIAFSFELAMIYLLPHDALLVPTRRGQRIKLVGRDAFGLKFFEQEFDPPPPGEILALPPDAFGDETPPLPISGTPLRFLQLVVPATSGTRDIDARIKQTATVDAQGYGTLLIEGGPRAVDHDVKVQILGLDDQVHAAVQSAEDGSFSLSVGVERGHHYLLAAGARILPHQDLTVGFSEELAADWPGISVWDGSRELELRYDLVETRAQARILPPAVWQAGRSYLLRLDQQLKDAAGNTWDRLLEIPFEVAESEQGETYDLPEARDFARLGSLLFVAAGDDGLAVLDASDPLHLKSFIGTEQNPIYFPFALRDPVMAVAVDPHARVYVAGGGVRGFGQLKILDPTALDPAAIAANPNDSAVRYAAFRGSTLISDKLGGGGISLPEGKPRRLAIHSEDLKARFRIGDEPPEVVEVSYASPPVAGADVLATFTGGDAVAGHPVTVRNLTLGRFARVDAEEDGSYEIQLKVRLGDRVEVLRNFRTLAYVAISGIGVQVVNVDEFYNEDRDEPGEWVPSDVIGTYSGYGDPLLRLCNAPVSDIGAAMLDLGLLQKDRAGAHPLSVVTLIGFKGLALFDSPLEGAPVRNPANLIYYNEVCLDVDNSPHVAALEIAESYPFDLDDNGRFEESEYRDYLLVAHRNRGIFVFDADNREDLKLVERMPMPGTLAELTLDRERRMLYVAGSAGGLHLLDFDHPPLAEPDADGDGKSDRLIETVALGGNTNSPTLVVPQLGVAYAGGLDRGVTAIAVASPRLAFVGEPKTDEEEEDPTAKPRFATLAELWPFGLPAPQPEEGVTTYPGAFRVLAALPGFLGEEVAVDLESLGPTGAPMVPAGDPEEHEDLPLTELAGEDHAVVLKRLAEKRWEEGYQLFLSKKIEAIADLRAADGYERTPDEDELCHRCPEPEDGSGQGGEEEEEPEEGEEKLQILSGNQIAIRLPDDLRGRLGEVYPLHLLERTEVVVKSIPWDISPALEQEPPTSPSDGGGAAVPGTLLNSGELTQDDTDLVLRGAKVDMAFERTYRSQALGNGPLGPGWDFVYRQRLRKLPTGDVEYFDGRGRRDTFVWEEGGEGQPAGYRSPPGRLLQLVRTSAGWVIIDAQHNLTRFDLFGRLIAMADWIKDEQSDESGTQLEFEYDTRSRLVRIEAHGREILLDYADDGRLEHVRDFSGREVDYEYDDAGRLELVKSPRVSTGLAGGARRLETSYEYLPASGGSLAEYLRKRDNLKSVTDAKGVETLAFTYADADQDGHADEVASETWGGDQLTIAYDFEQKSAVVTDRRGKNWTFKHDDAGHATLITGPTGAKVERTYAESGLLTSEKLPGGRRIESQEPEESDDPRKLGNLRQAKVIAGEGGPNGSSPELVTSYGDYSGRTNSSQAVTDPRGNVIRNVLDEVGLPTELIQADGGVVKTEYNKVGQPTKVTDPNGDVTTYTYYTQFPKRGYLEKMTVDPGGLELTTRYEVDDHGYITAEIDPRGVRYEYAYNEAGWLVEEKAPLGWRRQLVYDENGRVVEEKLAAGQNGSGQTSTHYEYGSLGEIKKIRREIEPGGSELVETFSYDENLNLTEAVAADGRITRTVYDDRNLPLSRTRGFGTPVAQTETFTYNADGELTETIDALGRSWKTVYDGYGRIKEQIDPLGGKVATSYDNNNNPLSVRRFGPAGGLVAISRFEHDKLNRPEKKRDYVWEIDPAGAAGNSDEPPAGSRALLSTARYDGASNLVEKVDPRGVTDRFEYDKAGRLKLAKSADGSERTYHYDASGNNWKVELLERGPDGEAIASQEQRVLDELGRATQTTDAAGNVTSAAYDVRGNLLRSTDAEGNVTENTWDGLDRLKHNLAPAGIATSWVYDAGSRVSSTTDALGQATTFTYDELGRLKRTTFADGKQLEVLEYDGGDRAVRTRDAMGSQVSSTYDPLDRLTQRTVVRGAGVEGPVEETYGFDGAGNMIAASSGEVAGAWRFDSLGRPLRESIGSRTAFYQFDDSGNLVRLQYPSGRVARFALDGANRLSGVGWQLGEGQEAAKASFRYRGQQVAEKVVGASLVGRIGFDAGRRPVSATFSNAAGERFFAEQVEWSPRNLRKTITRGDRNGLGYEATYDAAGRLVSAQAVRKAAAEQQNASVPGLPDSFGYTYDSAQNLLSKRQDEACDENGKQLPLDGSGRNRPGSIDGVPLEWDANGNLARKGDRHYTYDFRNRLTRVLDAEGAEIAAYTYDALNRRVAKEVGGSVEETTWSGWRPLETWQGQALKSRRTYGLGLDEVVAIEQDLDGAAGLEHEYVPVYDAVGNLAMLADPAGEPIEKYAYSPFGDRFIEVDDAPPAWHQVRVVGEEIWLEATEEIDLESLLAAAQDGTLLFRNATREEDLEIRLSLPVEEGRRARHRLVLAPAGAETGWPAAGEIAELTIPAAALRDYFGKEATAGLALSFTWPAAAQGGPEPPPAFAPVVDTAPPRVVQVCTTADGRLELQLSEPPDPERLAAAIALDGAAVDWDLDPDGYTLRSEPLVAGSYQLAVGTQPLDLDQRGLAAAFTLGVEVAAADPARTHFSAPLAGMVASSTVANPLGWHGLPYDEETGLYYVRHRYYDPEIGRFTSVDPLIFADGPNPYAFAFNSPFTFDDPTGEAGRRGGAKLAAELLEHLGILAEEAGTLGKKIKVKKGQKKAFGTRTRGGGKGKGAGKAAGKAAREATEATAEAAQNAAIEAAENAAESAAKTGRKSAGKAAGAADEVVGESSEKAAKGKSVEYFKDQDGNVIGAEGEIAGRHKGREKGHRPDPEGGLKQGDHRGHMIPENGVADPAEVNVVENMISEAPSSNLGPKKVVENLAINIKEMIPSRSVRFRAEKHLRPGETRPFAMSYFIKVDGVKVYGVTIFNP
jgi:RHS repeat-associated protein